MKIEVLQENLHLALQRVSKVIANKPQLPILSCVLFETSDKGVTLAATDLYLGIRTLLPTQVLAPGKVAIPAKTLTEIVSSLPAGPLTLEHTEGAITIQSKVGKTQIQCLASEEFPAFPTLPTETQTVPFALWADIQRCVGFATSPDQSRPVLTAVLLKSTDQELQAVATDGFRLAIKTFPASLTLTQNLLLPIRGLNEICRIGTQLKTETVSFAVSDELKQVMVSMEGTDIFVRMIEGDFPPYEKIIPTQFLLEVSFDAGEFADHLKRALIFARDASNIVKFKLSGEVLTCTATSSSVGTYTGDLPIKVLTGTEGTIAFNGRYLQDLLGAVKPQRLWFGMSESLKPAMFKVEGLEGFMYVVMPFRVNE